MPLIKSKSKKAFDKNAEAEMSSGKPQDQSLAIAYSVKRQAKKKKMAMGGMVDKSEHIESPANIVEGIMRNRKKMADGGMVDLDENAEESAADLDDINMDAAKKELYDDSQMHEEPMDSNEHDDPISSDEHDMVDAIRKKIRQKMGM